MSAKTTSPRRIQCRLDGNVATIDLGGNGEMLFLTVREATGLVENLETEVIGAVDDEIIVADVCLAKEEAWQLVDAIATALCDTTTVRNGQMLDWCVEGF
jgi:hypothetical protein